MWPCVNHGRYLSPDQIGGGRRRNRQRKQVLNADSRYNEVGCRRFSRPSSPLRRPARCLARSRAQVQVTKGDDGPRAGMRSFAALSGKRNCVYHRVEQKRWVRKQRAARALRVAKVLAFRDRGTEKDRSLIFLSNCPASARHGAGLPLQQPWSE